MTDLLQEFQALKGLCEAATPGPWRHFPEDDDEEAMVCQEGHGEMAGKCVCCLALMGTGDGVGGWTKETQEQWKADADFIAAARRWLPILIGMIEAYVEYEANCAVAVSSSSIGRPSPERVAKSIQQHIDLYLTEAMQRPDVQKMLKGGQDENA